MEPKKMKNWGGQDLGCCAPGRNVEPPLLYEMYCG